MKDMNDRAATVDLLDARALTDLEWSTHQRSAPSSDRAPRAKKTSEERLTVTGLFAGIGGLEQGFREAGYSSDMLCEFDPLARRILKRHFPDAEITTDFSTEETFDFRVARYGGGCSSAWIEIDGMATTFAQQLTSVSCQLAYKIAPFHSKC